SADHNTRFVSVTISMRWIRGSGDSPPTSVAGPATATTRFPVSRSVSDLSRFPCGSFRVVTLPESNRIAFTPVSTERNDEPLATASSVFAMFVPSQGSRRLGEEEGPDGLDLEHDQHDNRGD